MGGGKDRVTVATGQARDTWGVLGCEPADMAVRRSAVRPDEAEVEGAPVVPPRAQCYPVAGEPPPQAVSMFLAQPSPAVEGRTRS